MLSVYYDTDALIASRSNAPRSNSSGRSDALSRYRSRTPYRRPGDCRVSSSRSSTLHLISVTGVTLGHSAQADTNRTNAA